MLFFLWKKGWDKKLIETQTHACKKKNDNFPGARSWKGTSFLSHFIYNSPFGRNGMRWTYIWLLHILYIYIYIYVCVCVWERERERDWEDSVWLEQSASAAWTIVILRPIHHGTDREWAISGQTKYSPVYFDGTFTPHSPIGTGRQTWENVLTCWRLSDAQGPVAT
jgi:hypothetical protein